MVLHQSTTSPTTRWGCWANFWTVLPPACVQESLGEWLMHVMSQPTYFAHPPVHGVSRPHPSITSGKTMWLRGTVTELQHPLHSIHPFFSKPIIRQGSISEGERKWQKRNPAPVACSCIKASFGSKFANFAIRFVCVCVYLLLKKDRELESPYFNVSFFPNVIYIYI